MALTNINRFYHRDDFTSLPEGAAINPDVLFTTLSALPLGAPVVKVELLQSGEGVEVKFDRLPSENDFETILDPAIAAFVGGETTSQPFEFNSFGVTTTPGAIVNKIDQTTPLLDGGTYQVFVTCEHRLQAAINGDFSRASIIITRSDGITVQQIDEWPLSLRHAYNLPITFEVNAGQTVRVRLQLEKAGVGAGIAEMRGARITIDKQL